jgi:hypothetical protein
MDKMNVLSNRNSPGQVSSHDLSHPQQIMQNYQRGYQHSLQVQPQQLQQPTTGMQMQHTPYNKQIPMLVNNPLLANQPTDCTFNHQNATSNNSQQNFANPYTPTAYAPLSEDEELDVNTTEHRNNNPWQAVKKRKRASNKTPHEKGFRLDTSNQYQELHVEENTGMEENPYKQTVPRTSHQQTKEPEPPPIYIHGVTNYRAMTDSLALVTAKETYHSKTVSNNTVIIYPGKPNTYRRLISHLHEKDYLSYLPTKTGKSI